MYEFTAEEKVERNLYILQWFLSMLVPIPKNNVIRRHMIVTNTQRIALPLQIFSKARIKGIVIK
jgi:hypothetical protein